MSTRHESGSEAETVRIARTFAAGLGPAAVAVLLHGELGAGKTAFVRGIVAGVGGDPADVSSPTFVLMQVYAARRPVHHVDLYRLGPADVLDLEPELAELLADDAIVAIEWADRLPDPPPGAWRVAIDDRGDERRVITIDAPETSDPPAE